MNDKKEFRENSVSYFVSSRRRFKVFDARFKIQKKKIDLKKTCIIQS